MAPGGEMLRYHQHFGENVLRHGSHEWLPYSKNEVRLKSSNTNLSLCWRILIFSISHQTERKSFQWRNIIRAGGGF